MDGPKSKVDVIKPVILKAGIPLVIAVGSFIWAKTIAARRNSSDQSICVVDADSCNEEGTSSEIGDKLGFQEEVLGLGRLVEGLQERERKLEMQFLRYCELRDREALLQEMGNTLELELGRTEALSREVSSIEAEHKRAAEIALQYVKVLQEMQCLKSENKVTQRKVKRLLRKVKQQSDLVRDGNRRIEAQEKDTSRTRLELEGERDAIQKLEGEIRELRQVLEKLRQEKDEMGIKLNSVEESVLKTKREGASREDFRQLLKEMEQLQKGQTAEEKELIYLRWSNACLRHEITGNHVNHPDDHENQDLLTAKTDSTDLEAAEEGTRDGVYHSDHEGSSLGTRTCNIHFSKRKKLLQKLRKWIEGNGNDHSRVKVGPREAEEHRIVHARESCSSA
ncbi:protein CHUP1, chloroplastic [Punica granatum]|uniref:Protein CHUP1, chloroplastic n=2 Tax=Punica granatum TaxID=22663 RepID=A0A6P8CK39_PUNGR|nr:protein CHUP1, chloroplastic [Punica granatum]PKI57654.1 hypothetical protein CRG98_021982 [Punica granatum]